MAKPATKKPPAPKAKPPAPKRTITPQKRRQATAKQIEKVLPAKPVKNGMTAVPDALLVKVKKVLEK